MGIPVRKDVIHSCLIEKVLPVIRSKWPRSSAMFPIYVQQDNARLHIKSLDDNFLHEAREDGFDIRLVCQPLSSQYMNVLHLVFSDLFSLWNIKKHLIRLTSLFMPLRNLLMNYHRNLSIACSYHCKLV